MLLVLTVGVLMFIIGLNVTDRFTPTHYPKKTDDTVIVYDDFDYLSDSEENELLAVLGDFRDKTGVIPSVELTNDDYLSQNYGNMENFAFVEYVTHFKDEYHLLIVYSYGHTDEETGFNEFCWHVMWGDDLGKTITYSDEEFLGDTLQKEFESANGQNVSAAIVDSLNILYDRLINKTVNVGGYFMAAFGAIIVSMGIWGAICEVKAYMKSKEMGEVTYLIEGDPIKKTCKHCGCMYYEGTINLCLQCGTPVNLSE